MNSYSYSLRALVLAFLISGLPVLAFANESTSTLEASRDNLQVSNRTQFEDSPTSLRSFEELRAKMEWDKQDIDRDDASTTPEERDVVKRANPVRLAVHALLDSRELLGGIGQQVSEIAKEMNDLNATTTRMEIKMHSRGFLTRLFFGGDKDSAEIISQMVKRNQELITTLTTLLDQTTLSVNMRAMLTEQITALENAQIRLSNLAQKEEHAWGFFSWRFGSK